MVPPSLSVPYREGRLGFFTKKYRAGYFPEETKTEKKEEENIMAKEKKLVESITAREVDFAQWYTDVVREAKLCDYSGVKGCLNYLPNGYAIWENIQANLDKRFKEG